VVTIHDVYHLAYANQLPMAKRWYARALIANAVKKSDKIITVSNFSKSEILKYTDTTDSKVSVIHNGLDLSFFEEEISLKKLSKDNTFSFLNGSFFLYVGNFKKHKNVELILQAYLLWLSQYGSAVKVILVGKEFQGCSIRKYVNINPLLQSNVIFIDDASDSDLQWLYQNALALIMPSLYEGFGFTPLEAMASNCPAIVSDAASLPEVCGDAAYYIDPKSAEQLFLAMKHVAFDAEYRGELIEKGKRKAAEYSWKKAAEEHIKVFDSLILE
jgi:glycosyltransferase involved in cell wall biosynthesis